MKHWGRRRRTKGRVESDDRTMDRNRGARKYGDHKQETPMTGTRVFDWEVRLQMRGVALLCALAALTFPCMGWWAEGRAWWILSKRTEGEKWPAKLSRLI